LYVGLHVKCTPHQYGHNIFKYGLIQSTISPKVQPWTTVCVRWIWPGAWYNAPSLQTLKHSYRGFEFGPG